MRRLTKELVKKNEERGKGKGGRGLMKKCVIMKMRCFLILYAVELKIERFAAKQGRRASGRSEKLQALSRNIVLS